MENKTRFPQTFDTVSMRDEFIVAIEYDAEKEGEVKYSKEPLFPNRNT